MKIRLLVSLVALGAALSGCTIMDHVFCAPGCQSQTRNSSSLVNFLYPDGKSLPATNTIPELHVPLRVGLAFLPSQASYGPAALDAAQKQVLLERIRQRFSSRKFVSEIVIIPDYYLANARGFAGLDGVQRLYNVDVMALVSYDQVSHTDDNKLSLGYLTIVGAYILRGSSQDTATLVDLAVVDPATGKFAGDDVATQARQTMKNLGAVLEAGGATFADVVKTTIFLVDMNDFATVNEAYGESFKGAAPPARSTVAVAALPRGARVEIELIARFG